MTDLNMLKEWIRKLLLLLILKKKLPESVLKKKENSFYSMHSLIANGKKS